MIPSACPHDGSRLMLDARHLIDYAHGCGLTRVPDDEILDRYVHGEFMPAIPVMFRCLAAGHTVLDRPPSILPTARAQQENGRKGGKADKHFLPRVCAICDDVYTPTSCRQELCPSCQTLPRCRNCQRRHAREASCVTLRVRQGE